MTEKITANVILNALIGMSDGKIWSRELPFYNGSRRADFWTLEPIFSQQFRATAYEIKVTKPDFLNDSLEKQTPALKWSNRFWYVTPTGLLTKAHIPEWAGLMEYDGTQFTVRKRAPKREKAEPDWEFVVNLIRSSGQCQRDVEILKSQLAFHKYQHDRIQRQMKVRDDHQYRKYIKRYSQSSRDNGLAHFSDFKIGLVDDEVE